VLSFGVNMSVGLLFVLEFVEKVVGCSSLFLGADAWGAGFWGELEGSVSCCSEDMSIVAGSGYAVIFSMVGEWVAGYVPVIAACCGRQGKV
jgi:hypothetical protein